MILSLLIISQIGCEDFLEEKPYSVIPMDIYGQSSSEIASLIAPIYTGLRLANHTLDPGSAPIFESSGDACLVPTRRGGDWWDGGVGKEMRLGTWTPLNRGVVNAYDRIMAQVATCNQILYMVTNNTVISDAAKLEAQYQIRAARAFWYYYLVDGWGNVPIVTDFGDQTKPATKTRAEVYAFIMSELNDLKDKIRSDVTTSSYGLFTKGAIYSMLAKMYLNALVWNPTGGAKWQEAMAACDVVMAMPYKLTTEWKDNFVVFNEGCTETILAITNGLTTSSGGGERGMRIKTLSLHYYDYRALGLLAGGANGYSAMPVYVNAFDTTDLRYGSWTDHSYGTYLMGPMYDLSTGAIIITAHGRKLIHTKNFAVKYAIDADGWGQIEQEDGFRCRKWEFEKGVTAMQNDCALFRLADIYLMKAECLVRLGQDNAEATRLVNLIRKRGFPTNPSKLKSSVTLDDIYQERRFELAWEDFNRQDMIRFGTFLNPITGWRGALPAYRLIFPIPQTAINSNALLVQNPGY
jgi:starch-binding outer membrane protein, SusD/RagB family